MATEEFHANRQRFNDVEVVSAYGELAGLMPDEEFLIEKYMPEDARVLDLGVGTGRTAAALAQRAAVYIGLDYAEQMIATARERHPELDLRVGDATDLRDFADGAFDMVVFSYNGLDYLHPDEARAQSLQEIRRVLAPAGVLLLARHNPRAVLARPSASAAWPRLLATTAYSSMRRARRLLVTRAFWHGEGYVHEPFRGGLLHHMATPKRVQAELSRYGFRHELTLGCRARRRTHVIWTPWYSYAFVTQPPA
ncbi:MAG: class I SAM-dependent methyltransferase [Egibacteraceae bacterium]